MATFTSIVIYNNKKSNGTWQVYIRLTHKRKVKYLPQDKYVGYKDLNNKHQIISRNTLDWCHAQEKKYSKILDQYGDLAQYTVDELADYLVDTTESIDFIANALQHIKKIRPVQPKSADLYTSTVRLLIKFHGKLTIHASLIPEELIKKTKLPISMITKDFLEKLEVYLTTMDLSKPRGKNYKATEKPERIGQAYTTIAHHMRNIRTLHNAIKGMYNKEDLNIIRIPYSPFKAYKIPEMNIPVHRHLCINDILRIKSYKTKYKREMMGRDVFMMIFYLAGINTIDLYEMTKREEDILIYNRAKTDGPRKDKALMMIRIQPELERMMGVYQGKERIFDFYSRYVNATSFVTNVNKALHKIGEELQLKLPEGKPLTTYFARHSWAQIAVQADISTDVVDMALDHFLKDKSGQSLKHYVKIDYEKINTANRVVLDLLKPK